MQAGADSGGAFYTIRSYCRWAVASLPAKVCCLRGLLPRVVVGPAQTRWSDRPRPSLPQIPAQGWHHTPGASSANVRRCTTRPGATDRRPAAAAWTGTAATCDKLPPSSDNFGSCSRFLHYIDCRLVLANRHTRACVVIQGKCAHVEFEQGAGDHVQQSRNARRGLLALL